MADWHPAGWQTLGPFFNDRFITPADADLTRRTPQAPAAEGEPVEIEGTVYRAQGEPHRDVLVEIWQANHHGKYDHPADRRNLPVDPNFKGFGRLLTKPDGSYRFCTVKPGPVPAARGGWQAPHINVSIFAVGLLRRLITRIYFADEPANAEDPVLLGITDPAHRATLIAELVRADTPKTYRFDLIMRGAGETAYFVD